eukprot:1364144-Amorphochlora_amoeboformis.AAC.1
MVPAEIPTILAAVPAVALKDKYMLISLTLAFRSAIHIDESALMYPEYRGHLRMVMEVNRERQKSSKNQLHARNT